MLFQNIPPNCAHIVSLTKGLFEEFLRVHDFSADMTVLQLLSPTIPLGGTNAEKFVSTFRASQSLQERSDLICRG